MGVSLAKVVLSATWAHLTPAAGRVFAFMAITALDHDKPPRYFAGQDALVLCLDGRLHEPGAKRKSQYRRVRRLLDQLRREGGVVPLNAAHHGQQAEYEIRVFPTSKAGQNCPPSAVPKEGQINPPKEGQKSPPSDDEGGLKLPAKAGQINPPKEQGGTSKEEEVGGGTIEPVSAQPYLGAPEALRDKRERCAKCGRSERDCRARSARHGAHDYEPVELTPLRLA